MPPQTKRLLASFTPISHAMREREREKKREREEEMGMRKHHDYLEFDSAHGITLVNIKLVENLFLLWIVMLVDCMSLFIVGVDR